MFEMATMVERFPGFSFRALIGCIFKASLSFLLSVFTTANSISIFLWQLQID